MVKAMNKMKASQKGIIINENTDLDKLFDFPKLIIKDIFREMELKEVMDKKIKIDIFYQEV